MTVSSYYLILSWNCIDFNTFFKNFQDRSDEEDEHVFLEPSVPVKFEAEEAADINDPRLRRLRAARTNVEDRHAGSDNEDAEDDRMSRHRRIHEPEVFFFQQNILTDFRNFY